MAENGYAIDEAGVLARCESCGQRNRLKYENLKSETRCGNCKTPLKVPGVTLPVHSPDLFHALVARSTLPILVDFWAPWCGPCKMLAPELEKVAAQGRGEFLVAKVNTDQLQEVAARFQISSIPTLALLKNGQEVRRQAGASSAAAILSFVRQAV